MFFPQGSGSRGPRWPPAAPARAGGLRPAITACSAFGSSRTRRSAIAWKSALSCSPTATSVGALTALRSTSSISSISSSTAQRVIGRSRSATLGAQKARSSSVDRVEVAGFEQPLFLLRVGAHLLRPVVVRQRRIEQHERRDQLRVPGREVEADEAAVGRAHQRDRRFGGQGFGEPMPPHLARQVEPLPHLRAGDAGVNEDDQPSPSPDSSSTARNASCGTSTRPTCFMRFLPAFCFSSSLRLRLTSPP